MTWRHVLNRYLDRFDYVLERTGGDRLAGRNLHRDINLMLRRKPHPVIFDLGANEGQSARSFLEDFDRPKVFCFEPCAATFARLEERFGKHPGVRLIRSAVGETEAQAELNIFAQSEMNSLLSLRSEADLVAAQMRELQVLEKEQVEVVSLDSFCRKSGLPEIDVLKMDCQGAEMGILRGATGLLRDRRIKVIYLEVLFLPLYAGQASLQDYCQFLQPFGMELTGFYRQAFRRHSLFHADVCFHLQA